MTTASRDDSSDGANLTADEVENRFISLVTSNYTADDVRNVAQNPVPREPAAGARFATPDATSIVRRAFGPRDWPTTPDVAALEDAQTRFTPPNPSGVLKAADPIRRAAAIGAVGFPILTILAFVLRVALGNLAWPIWPGPIFGVLFLASLLVLLWRMPKARSDRDDDGAVV